MNRKRNDTGRRRQVAQHAFFLLGALLLGLSPWIARAGAPIAARGTQCENFSATGCRGHAAFMLAQAHFRAHAHRAGAGGSSSGLNPAFNSDFEARLRVPSFSYAPAGQGGFGQKKSSKSRFSDFAPGQSTGLGQHIIEGTVIAAPIAAYALSYVLDHRLHYDDSGIWKRKYQLDFAYAAVLAQVGSALWFGGKSRFGKTLWRSIDASFYTAVSVEAMKYVFSRARPYQSSSPHHWFQGACCQSFPSGEVSYQASLVTPFIAEYYKQYPWVWALEALPAYDALARMKVHGHWQTDVLAAWAIGTAWGLYAHFEPNPLILSIMPHGIMVGFHMKFGRGG